MSKVHFIWRNLVAEYDLATKQLYIDHHNLYISALEDYKEDMIKFKDWLVEVAKHQNDYKATIYGTNETVTAKPYNVEIY